MIEIDFLNNTYTCPYCGCKQTFNYENSAMDGCGYHRNYLQKDKKKELTDTYINVYSIVCSNKLCKKITVIGHFLGVKKQVDLLPQNVYKQYPDYVPEQIRNDYIEASTIINDSGPIINLTRFYRQFILLCKNCEFI